MTGINVNQRGVIQSQLKKGEIGVQQAQKADPSSGTNIEGPFDELVDKLKNGDISFLDFKKGLIERGVDESTIKVTTLSTSDGDCAPQSILQFQTDTKRYTFFVPTEYVKESSEPGPGGPQGTGDGRGVQGRRRD